jgi:hypothetical protein
MPGVRPRAGCSARLLLRQRSLFVALSQLPPPGGGYGTKVQCRRMMASG